MGLCKNLCHRIQGTKKHVDFRFLNPLEYRRCRQCEICFPLDVVPREVTKCPCCHASLCCNGYASNSRRNRYEMLVRMGVDHKRM